MVKPTKTLPSILLERLATFDPDQLNYLASLDSKQLERIISPPSIEEDSDQSEEKQNSEKGSDHQILKKWPQPSLLTSQRRSETVPYAWSP